MGETWREVSAEWMGDSAFIGRNTKGGSVQMGTLDGKPGVGPMELLLVGLAGCTGIDIVDILIKKRQEVTGFTVKVRGKRRQEYPQIYTEIEVLYLLWGDNIEPRAVEHAIKLSEDKYCSASAMLGKAAEIKSSYRILAPGEQVELEDDGTWISEKING